MKTMYVFLADGFEEIEALAPIDVMRRAGLSVTTVSVTGNLIVQGAHGIIGWYIILSVLTQKRG